MINIRQIIDVKPHPLEEFFRKHGVRQWMVATFCGCSPPQMSIYLRGIVKVPPGVEKRLREFAEKIEEAEAQKSQLRN